MCSNVFSNSWYAWGTSVITVRRWRIRQLPMGEEWNSWVQIQSMGVRGTKTHIHTHRHAHAGIECIHRTSTSFSPTSRLKVFCINQVCTDLEWCPSVCLLSSRWTQSWFPQYRESNTVDGTSGEEETRGTRQKKIIVPAEREGEKS